MSFRISLVKMPLLEPFSNSRGSMVARKAIILQLKHGDIQAYSECVTDESPSSTQETNETAIRAIKGSLAKKMRGSPPSPKEFIEAVKSVEGEQMAKSAIEMLLWDYSAKSRALPLDVALGESKGSAEAGISLGLGTKGEVISKIDDALRRGYKRIKVKIERAAAFETLKSIRLAFPWIPLSADANGSFELERDVEVLKRMDRFDLRYLEQPLGFGAIIDHAKLAKEISTPICLDESVATVHDAERILEVAAASVFNVKPGRVGGLSAAMEIARMARERGAHVWVGGMLETGVGRAFNVAFASQKRVDYPGDVSPNDRWFEADLVKNPFGMKEGSLRPNQGNGIGVELDREFFAKSVVKNWNIF